MENETRKSIHLSGKLKLLAALAAMHCLIVILGSTGVRLESTGAIGELVTYYGALTGAERGFGFFAPEVTTEARAVFELVDAKGTTTIRRLEDGVTSESALRMYSVTSQFWQALDSGDTAIRHSMAASLAGKMFARYPEAVQVSVKFDVYVIPTMEEFRDGVRPGWKRLYQVKLNREANRETSRKANRETSHEAKLKA